MQQPFFYLEELDTAAESFVLTEETSKHIVQVLRMKPGEALQLTDGKGNIIKAVIKEDHKKKCVVSKVSMVNIPPLLNKVTIAISLIKNTSRFEWFLEKATEIGVSAIIPLICARTEKQHFRNERMKSILISAMLQSKQAWLPELQEPVEVKQLWQSPPTMAKLDRYIAHCEADKPKAMLSALRTINSSIILIGPEGDFNSEEIDLAHSNNFIPVSLGKTILRTETAGVVAAVILNATDTS
jgi:16S rRNA (uracil1498-N3)-methyltransferase